MDEDGREGETDTQESKTSGVVVVTRSREDRCDKVVGFRKRLSVVSPTHSSKRSLSFSTNILVHFVFSFVPH